MPKLTAKYSTALDAARSAGVEVSDNQEVLYQRLQDAGYFWDSQAKRWDYSPMDEADDPTPLILVRVWTDEEVIQEAADDIVSSNKRRWQLVKRSEPYRNRPPKQREARIYLEFLPKRSQ